MPDAEYEWWIDQKVRDKDGTLHITRLLHYGPFRNETAAQLQIDKIKTDGPLSSRKTYLYKTA